MKVNDVTSALESLAPRAYQESYDNAGLITGSGQTELTGVLICLDSTEKVIDEAIEKNCNMVVAHHPIVFKGLKTFTGKNYVERVIIKALKHDIAIYAIHTNLDNVRQGVNEEIADRLELSERSILIPKANTLSKLEFYCPKQAVDSVKKSVFASGAGQIGNYDNCSFESEGIGSFRPLEGAQPETGQIGALSKEEEVKLELIFPSHLQYTVVAAMKEAHPYEEVAHQITRMSNDNQEVGSGIIGVLDSEENSLDFLARLKVIMEAKVVRHTAICKEKIRKIAIVGGSGSFAIMAARARGADVLVTADIKYHEFFDADGQLLIADIGHYESEHYTSKRLQQFLSKKFPSFALLLSEHNTNPVNYL